MAKILQSTRGKKKRQEESRLCEQHNKALTLFCEEDLELLCPLCTQSPDHQGHQVRPMGEAASHHRLRLYSYISKQMVDVQKLISIQNKKPLELREKVQKQEQKLASEFEHLSQFMDASKRQLAEEEKDIQQKLLANTTAFSDHLSNLRSLEKEVAEKKHVMPDVKFLMDIKGVLHRCDNLKSPAVYWFQLRREECSFPPQCSALQKIIQRFREEVTLDPETAHPNLLVSEDKKSVTFVRRKQRVRRNPKRFAVDPVVLGTEGFDCGRHYWEVQVDDKPEWAVGSVETPFPRRESSPC
ncbi:hypothetical protein QTO34_015885 [Cnephaeus nilssonii]|uniref:Uncharacterized protein n=1 Tax=Cnephaeus nilssonii TaxID=3371016 RepID=A0AA40LTC1_CNENI|nr:hypothetical protein QTO34_015885 [Eptesicus nilssonii]